MDPVEDEEVEDEEVEDFDEAGGEDMLRCWGGFFFFFEDCRRRNVFIHS